MTPTNRIAFLAITALFFIWGFLTVLVDAFIPRLKEVFELSYGEAGLVQVAWFLAYLIISIPGGIIISRLGYKKGVLLGLTVAGLGCFTFFPAASFRLFPVFLLALFILASGLTILQVAANPFVSVLGPEEKASSRLNLAQAFNSLGTTIAPILSAAFLLSDSIMSSGDLAKLDSAAKEAYYKAEASAVQLPFLLLGASLIAVAIAFAFVNLPKIAEKEAKGSFKKALSFKNLRLGLVGIFVYVGAEVAIGSYLINYMLSMNMDLVISSSPFLNKTSRFLKGLFSADSNPDAKAVVGAFLIFYWGGAMVGRFVGSWLTSFRSPAKVLAGFASAAIILLLITLSTSGSVAMFAALGIGFFNSIMFPTIFTLSLEGLGDAKPRASGLLCTAIFGGAVIPPLFGLMVDWLGFNYAFFLPVVCYLYIYYFARETGSFLKSAQI